MRTGIAWLWEGKRWRVLVNAVINLRNSKDAKKSGIAEELVLASKKGLCSME